MNNAVKIFFFILGFSCGNALASNAIRALDLDGIVVQEVSRNADQTVNVTIRQPLFAPFAFMEAWRAFEDRFNVEIYKVTLLDEGDAPYSLFDLNEDQ